MLLPISSKLGPRSINWDYVIPGLLLFYLKIIGIIFAYFVAKGFGEKGWPSSNRPAPPKILFYAVVIAVDLGLAMIAATPTVLHEMDANRMLVIFGASLGPTLLGVTQGLKERRR